MEQKSTDTNETPVVEQPTVSDSLESTSEASLESSGDTGLSSDQPIVSGGTSGGSSQKPPKQHRLREFFRRFNIYLLLFILVLLIAAVVVGVLYAKNHNATVTETNNNLSTQNLSADALNQLADSGVQVGDPKQVLNIQSNSIFSGTVLVRGQLQAANGLKVGGDLAINGLSVSGSASIAKLQTQDLAVSGNGAFQGQLSARGGLSAGSGSFSGGISAPTVTTNSLQLNGALTLNNHLITGGSRPGIGRGSAVGNGGTVNLNGSDTSGTVNVNTGGGASAGCFASVTFAKTYNGQPHVVVTPIGTAAAGLSYYITRTSSGFSICSINAAPSNGSFAFDYMVMN